MASLGCVPNHNIQCNHGRTRLLPFVAREDEVIAVADDFLPTQNSKYNREQCRQGSDGITVDMHSAAILCVVK